MNRYAVRLVALLTTISGIGWMIGLMVANRALANPPWFFVGIALACTAIAGLLFVTMRDTAQLASRLGIVWLITVAATYIILMPLESGWALLGPAILFGSISFVLWLSLPMVVFSFIAWRTPEHEREARQGWSVTTTRADASG